MPGKSGSSKYCSSKRQRQKQEQGKVGSLDVGCASSLALVGTRSMYVYVRTVRYVWRYVCMYACGEYLINVSQRGWAGPCLMWEDPAVRFVQRLPVLFLVAGPVTPPADRRISC